jgi:iron complex transport system substrate-binding protein
MRVWISVILVVGAVLVGLTLLRGPEQRQVSGQRIISLSPAITEILFELGLGEQIVGVSEYSDYPPAARQIPRMGKYGDPNIELIIRAKPDLVVSQRISPEKITLLKNTLGGVCEVLLLKVDTLAEIIESTQQLAQASGTIEHGQKLVEHWQKKIEEMETQYARLAEEDRVRVYVEVGANPLRTCGPGTYLSQMIRLAGGRNLGDAATGSLWPIVSSETVVVWNPQVILVLGMKRTGGFKEQISSRLGWDNIEAVKNGRIVELPDAYQRQGPRLFEEAEKLAQIITGQRQEE